MKRIEDLKGWDVIHCPTFIEWVMILRMNPTNKINTDNWFEYGSNTYYRPKADYGKGGFGDLDFSKTKGCTIHQSNDFLADSVKVKDDSYQNFKICIENINRLFDSEMTWKPIKYDIDIQSLIKSIKSESEKLGLSVEIIFKSK